MKAAIAFRLVKVSQQKPLRINAEKRKGLFLMLQRFLDFSFYSDTQPVVARGFFLLGFLKKCSSPKAILSLQDD